MSDKFNLLTYIAAVKKIKHIITNDMTGDVTGKIAGAETVKGIIDSVNAPNGIAGLDDDGKTHISQLPNLILTNKSPNATLGDETGLAYVYAASHSVSSGELTFAVTAKNGAVRFVIQDATIIDHIYYARVKFKATSKSVAFYVGRRSNGSNIAPMIYHTGDGEYMEAYVWFKASAAETVDIKIVDYRESGWNNISVKEVVWEDITAEYGINAEPTANQHRTIIANNNADNTFYPALLKIHSLPTSMYLHNIGQAILPLYVDITNDVLNVISKYNDIYDLKYMLGKIGVNNIFDFKYIHKLSNTSGVTLSNINASDIAWWSYGTDTFSPYNVQVTNNADGERMTSGFTGGAHGYNGDSTGSATGRTALIAFYVDGRQVTQYAGYASYIDIMWINYVQAWNTIKSDGSGREVLKETYRMHYDGHQWAVNCMIEPLEEVIINTYYGLQLSCVPWNDYTFFHSAINNAWFAGNISCNAGDKNCNIITVKKGSDYADVELMLNKGLGRGTCITAAANNAFRANYDKIYYRLISDATTCGLNDVLSYGGYYRFYNNPVIA